MKFIEITENELMHVELLDSQHKNFAKHLNELFELLGQDKPETIKYLLNQLSKEIKTHFETEEEFMKQNNFEHFYSHKLEHDRFLNKFQTYAKDVSSGKERLNLEQLQSAKKWFFNHFEINDRKLGIYLAGKNIK